MFGEEAADGGGVVAADLRDAGGDVGVHVGAAVERLLDPVDILGVIGEVDADEGGVGVACDDAVESVEKLQAWRVYFRVAEPPRSVVFEFVPALILVVVGFPEGFRVGDVDGDGHGEFAAAFPDGIEFRVVDGDDLFVAVADGEAEAFVLFEAGGTGAVSGFDLGDGAVGEPGVVPAAVVEVHVVDEASRGDFVGAGFVFLEGGDAVFVGGGVAAAEVSGEADAGLVHDGDGALDVFVAGAEVEVEIDDAVSGAPGGGGCGELGAGEGRRGEQCEDGGAGGRGRVHGGVCSGCVFRVLDFAGKNMVDPRAGW